MRYLVFILFGVLIAGVPVVSLSQENADTMGAQDTIDVNYNDVEIERLKQDKNELIDTVRSKENNIRYLALALTVTSILFLIFLFAFLSVRRRKRLDISELQKEINDLKTN